MASAPASLVKLVNDLDARPDKPRSYQLGGIVGDASHMNPPEGYHVSARDMGFNWNTYGLNTARDHSGGQANPDFASAWDLTMNDADMRLVTGRLIAAAKAGDKRVTAVIREIAGTTNNSTVHTYYTDTNQENTANGQWDPSHLHHVHLSFFRDTSPDYTKIAGVLDVVCGTDTEADMPLTDDDIKRIWAYKISDKGLDGTPETTTAAAFLANADQFARGAYAVLANPKAFAAAIAKQIPGVTEQQVEDAVKVALREGTQ